MTKRPNSVPGRDDWPTRLQIPVTLLILAIAGYVAFDFWARQWYTGFLPKSIEVSGVRARGEVAGFREGCGAVVFDLSPRLALQIQKSAGSELVSAMEAREGKPPRYYSAWKATPHVPAGDGMKLEDQWLLGIDCASLAPPLRTHIDEALTRSGSYYSTTHEAGLIIIPSLQLVVLSHFG